MTPAPASIALQADDGHRWTVAACVPPRPHASLLWLPALGVAARHYLPFAQALAGHGIASFLHEWRGNGSSSLRAARDCDWNYRTLLTRDLPVAERAVRERLPGLPRIVGGHSLGGQLAACRLGLDPALAERLWLVASGAPYWRAFPFPHRAWLAPAYRFLAWLAARRGALPGRLVGFGGNEARGLIRDWSRSGLTGRYAAAGLEADLEQRMEAVAVEVRAAVMAADWLGPESSLRFLLSKLPRAQAQVVTFEEGALGTRADHFAWMRQPDAVAGWLCADLRAQAPVLPADPA